MVTGYWEIKPYKRIDKRIEISAGYHKIYVDSDDIPFDEAVKLAERIANLPSVEKFAAIWGWCPEFPAQRSK